MLGDHYLVFNNGAPVSVREYNSPAFSKNVAKVTGLFFQDAWSMTRLTLNLGARWDKYVGELPEQSSPGGRFAGPRRCRNRKRSTSRSASGAPVRHTI